MITLFRNIKSQIIKLFSCMIIGICAIIGSINAANAIDYPFQVQTTSLAIRSKVYFNISATGTFYVDCGTNGVLYDADSDEPVSTTVINSNNNVARLYCKYSSSGIRYIKFGGQATGYSNNYSTPAISFGALEGYGKVSAGNSNKIYSLSGSLATIFPYLGARSDGLAPSFYGSFSGITSLQYIDSSMFSGYSGNLSGANFMFLFTFVNCTSLQSIPSGLFSNITVAAPTMFNSTFYGCTGLTSIPANLFSNMTTGAGGAFSGTFGDCSNLTSIPDGLFSNITGVAPSMFMGTFYGCTGLTSIPANLFSNITTSAEEMFKQTFYGCTGLTSIPANLFSNITTGAQSLFKGTFQGCTGLTSIPANLFSNITTSAQEMFKQTFDGCTGLNRYIPSTLFSGLIANNSPYATDMMTDIFANTGLMTSCPSGTQPYTTGYESYWNSKVACVGLPYTVTYSCGEGGGTAPANGNAAYDSLFTPATNTCTTPNGKVFIGWKVSGTNDIQFGPFTWNYTGNKTFTAQYQTPPFSVTTVNMSAGDQFIFGISAKGNFYVDCGSGGTLKGYDMEPVPGNIIVHTEVQTGIWQEGKGLYVCEYSTGGVKTIRFAGRATGYGISYEYPAIIFPEDMTGNHYISSVSGDLSALFPYLGSFQNGLSPHFYVTFGGCTNLTSIPDTLFSGYRGDLSDSLIMFYYTFGGCTGLTSIPANLFSGITNAGQGMFANTFLECTGLTSIPENLFSNITTGAPSLFIGTFKGCTGLTSLPETLFANITNSEEQMFYQTFEDCTGLTGYIPPTLFAGLINRNSPDASDFMTDIFSGDTGLATSCTSYNKQKYTTGYESYFGDYVSCAGTPYTVTYSCGTLGGTAPNSYTTAWYNDSFVPAPNTCTVPTGYNFAGWAVSGTNTVVTSPFTWTYGENKTFTAQSEPSVYTITYSCGDGFGNAPTTSTSATYNTSFTPATNTCTKTGYTFDGWAISGTNDTESTSFTWNYTENKTLTAQWEIGTYTCTSGYYLPANIDQCTACLNGYTCGGGTYTFDPDEDQGLTPNTLTVTWTNYSGGSQSSSCTYGGSVTPPAASTRPGYTFNGWVIQ